MMMSHATTAYSNNANRTAISTLYTTGLEGGWCKSSGFAGTGGKFALDSTANKMKVKIDATISGADGSGWYEITLEHENGTLITGESIAEDMETKIRALTLNSGDSALSNSYKSVSVEFVMII